IIAMVHLEDEEERRIANAFPVIRLIIGGHNHNELGPIWLDRTLIAKNGSAGRNVGRGDLEFENKKLRRMKAGLSPGTNVRPDPQVTKVLEAFNDKVKAKMAQPVGESTAELTYSTSAESPLADLIADAFRERGETEIAIHNVGGIRATIAKGRITWGNVFEVLPFQNTMVTLKMTGAQLKKTLERGLPPGIGLVALSGLRVQFDLKKPVGRQLVSALLTNGSSLEDSQLYSITTNDF